MSDPPTILRPSPSLSLLTSMVVSLPGFTSQMAGSGSGSSGALAKLPPREPLEWVDGPPCCLSTALPWWWWCWWWTLVAVATPLKAAEEAGTEPGRPAADVGVAAEVDGRKEEEDEEADKEGKGSTGVAAAVGPVEASDSLAMAASRDETEVAARAPIDGEGDCEGE